MSRRHRADNNQKEIVDYLRDTGRSVLILSQVGGGAPDLLVGARGENILLEVKGKNGKLRSGQKKFMREWAGEAYVVRSIDEVQKLLGDK